MPTAIAPNDGSAVKAHSRAGMAATDIQSTSASRPILPAESWLTTVENVLLMSPRLAAATIAGWSRRTNCPPISTEIHILRVIRHFFAVPGSAIFRC
jgi:hypothetical protein